MTRLLQVHVLRFPSLQDLTQALQKRKPNMLFLSSGIHITGHGSAVNDITLKPLEFKSENGALRAHLCSVHITHDATSCPGNVPVCAARGRLLMLYFFPITEVCFG